MQLLSCVHFGDGSPNPTNIQVTSHACQNNLCRQIYIYIIWVNPIINHPQYMEGYYGVYPYDWDDVSYDHQSPHGTPVCHDPCWQSPHCIPIEDDYLGLPHCMHIDVQTIHHRFIYDPTIYIYNNHYIYVYMEVSQKEGTPKSTKS